MVVEETNAVLAAVVEETTAKEAQAVVVANMEARVVVGKFEPRVGVANVEARVEVKRSESADSKLVGCIAQ